MCFGPAWQTSIAELITPARAAENAGFDRVATGEFRSDALVWMAALAGATRSIPVATTIASIALRHPTVVGEAVAALRDLHGDRIQLGLGVSHPSLVTDDLGVAQPTLDDLENYVAAVRGVLEGRAWRGGAYRVPAHARNRITASSAPIRVSVLGEVAARRAARYADGIILTWSPVTWTSRIVTAVREVDAETGHKTDVLVVLPTLPNKDIAVALTACARHLRPYLSLPSYRRMLEAATGDPETVASAVSREIDDQRAADILGRELIESVAGVGDRDSVLEAIRSSREVGADGILLYPLDTGSGWKEAVNTTITRYAPSN